VGFATDQKNDAIFGNSVEKYKYRAFFAFFAAQRAAVACG
jgi:hypothetical protein